MKWIFAKLPRPMQRTFADDLRWAAAYFVALLVVYFLFDDAGTGLLIAGVIWATIIIVGLNVARRVSRRPRR
jgi:hypothetical protein